WQGLGSAARGCCGQPLANRAALTDRRAQGFVSWCCLSLSAGTCSDCVLVDCNMGPVPMSCPPPACWLLEEDKQYQNKHKDICQNSGLSCCKDVNFQISEASTNAKFIYSTGNTAHKLTEVLAGQSTSKPSSDPPQSSTSLAPSSNSEKAIAWKDLRPKGKGRYHPLTSKTLPKPSKNKKIVGFPSPTRGRLSTSPQALKDTLSYDLPVTCAHCNIFLPLPTLQKHEVRGDVLDSASYMLEQRATPAY
uniref:XIAP-associated factor 1 C-terminal domain-containing protein n=1 Tax=Cairina moschata TaxID=8855 RepID=A0A8C3CZZ3_CAIMO